MFLFKNWLYEPFRSFKYQLKSDCHRRVFSSLDFRTTHRTEQTNNFVVLAGRPDYSTVCRIFRRTFGRHQSLKILLWNGTTLVPSHIREKSYPSLERPTLNGSVLKSIIVEKISKAFSSMDDNVEKRLLKIDDEIALISTARKLAEQMDKHGIEYAIIGGFALNVHGFKRQTMGVDILLTEENLNNFHAKLKYNGFVPRSIRGSRRSFRDPVSNVGVDIITTGEYPGDGKEKSISFPDPSTVSQDIGGLKVVNLQTLIILKLASYLSMPQHRMRDRTDVSGLVKFLTIDESFAMNLHKDVVDEFRRIVDEATLEQNDFR